FFQAEDGIRDLTVTGVQTCALPISARVAARAAARRTVPRLVRLRVNEEPRRTAALTSGCPDSNWGPLRPERSALPGCATPRGATKPSRGSEGPVHDYPGLMPDRSRA